MSVNRNLGFVKLTADELTSFASSPWAEKYPPILTIAQAADMLQVPVGTLRFWRTTGRLNGCSRRYGRVLRFYRPPHPAVLRGGEATWRVTILNMVSVAAAGMNGSASGFRSS